MTCIQVLIALHVGARAAAVLVAAGALAVSAGCQRGVDHPVAPTPAATQLHDVTSSNEQNAASAASMVTVHHGSILYISPLFALAEGPFIELQGTGGFRFDGIAIPETNATGAFFDPTCSSVVGCPAGTTIPFSADWRGGTLAAAVRLRGKTYEGIGSQASEAVATIQLSGSVTFPEHTADTASVSAPFQLSGEFADFATGVRVGLTGHGRVTFSLEWSEADQTWYVVRADFQFSPGRGPR